MIAGKSDHIVVVLIRLINGEPRVWQKGQMPVKTQGPYTEMGHSAGCKDSVKQDPVSRRAAIAAKARMNPNERFNNLLHHLTYELIEECLNKIPKSTSVGVDGMTVEQTQANLNWLLPPILKQIHQGRYEAPSVRRAYIPKADGKKRPIGVPTVLDRSIQSALALILNEIYEQDFLKCSFGFRPGLSCHHALATVNGLLHRFKANHVLEVDIQDFFGSLSHEWLMKFLGHRIGDPRVLKLIQSWLTAGVMENQQRQESSEHGTIQGGSISPLLANVYLHYVLDLWFEKKIRPQYAQRADLVRYCDDFCFFFRTEQDLLRFKPLLQLRLTSFGLTISCKKTHQTHLSTGKRSDVGQRRHMTFLGFTIFRAKRREGAGTKIVFQTATTRMTRAFQSTRQKLKGIIHKPIAVQVAALSRILRGHFNYYGIAGNADRISQFRNRIINEWRYCLSRRSQRSRITWDKMKALLDEHPLPAARLKLNYQELQALSRL